MSQLANVALFVFVAGCVGGLVNALMSDGGFVSPRTEVLPSGAKVTRPGWIGNVFIGGIGGLLTWGLYSSFANVVLIGASEPRLSPPAFTVGALLGAVLTGAGGSRVISDLVDKKVGEAARQATLDGTQKSIEVLKQQLERLQDPKKG
jgi:hypothetical protein